MSKALNHERRSGMKQGAKDRAAGTVLAACPYRQWPLSQLRRYQAWVKGWHATFTGAVELGRSVGP
jgi:hypothetical protein